MLETALPLLGFAFAAAITPGPNNMMVFASAINHGWRKSMPHYLGICIGFPAMCLAVALGLSKLFDIYPVLHVILKWAGFAFLAWMAYKIAASTSGIDANGSKNGKPITFWQAALFQWLNPKAWIMVVSAISTYTTVHGNHTAEALLVVLVFTLVTFPSVAVWVWAGQAMQRFLDDPKRLRLFNWTMAVLLVGSMLPFMVQ